MIWIEEVKKPTRRKRHIFDIYCKNKEYLEAVLQSYGKLSLDRNDNEEVKNIEYQQRVMNRWHVYDNIHKTWDINHVDGCRNDMDWYRLRLYVYDEGRKEILNGLNLKRIEGSRVTYAYYKEP